MLRVSATALLLVALAVPASAGYDVGVDTVHYIDTLVYNAGPYLWVYPEFRNYGTLPVDSIEYGWEIDSAGVVVEHQSCILHETVQPGESTLVGLWCEWPNHNRFVYCYIDMVVYTNLPGDEDRSNDTCYLRFWFSSAMLGDTFLIHDYCSVYEVDGIIDREEYVWHNDISDFAGRAGTRRSRTSVFVHTGWGERVWFGADIPALTDRQDGDRVLCYADVDGDREWEPDSSEGLYTVEVRNGIDSVFFTPMPGGEPEPCSGMVAASSIGSGNLQFEIGYPFNGNPWWYSYGAVSFWRGDSCWGWWPQSLDTADVRDPAGYGIFSWVTMAIEDADEDKTPVGCFPSVMRVPELARMDCRVMDIMGRDVTERKAFLSPGVYFVYRASGVEREASRVHKVVIQR